MSGILHAWWAEFGELIDVHACAVDDARRVAAHINSGAAASVALIEARRTADGHLTGLLLEVEVERPQDLAEPIRGIEPIAVIFDAEGNQPAVVALRPDFPHTMHQNWMPEGMPRALCIDDRPWDEARLSFTPADFLRRIQLWLARAARGELHDRAQPLEPLFFKNAVTIIVPAAALTSAEQPPELVGFLRAENEKVVITQPAGTGPQHAPGFVVLTLRASPQGMGRLRQAPKTLDTLAAQLQEYGIDLARVLNEQFAGWAGLGNDAVRRLAARLALVIAFPVTGDDGQSADDLRAFITYDTAGDVGVALGVLAANNSEVGSSKGYVKLLAPAMAAALPELPIEPADVHLAFERRTGVAVSGQLEPDLRKSVLIGAGSLGSQLAVNLAREGRFRWTVVDNDTLLPHNLARHALYPVDVGLPKSLALARRLETLLCDQAVSIKADFLAPAPDKRPQIDEQLAAGDLIIDASASVAVSRHLSDLEGANGRRLSLFFNPSGTAIVLLAEGQQRDTTLRDLEAQYHRLIQTETGLAHHLRPLTSALRYSGSCRAVTNRIPASRAALMSAIASQAVVDALSTEGAQVRVWTLSDENAVSLVGEAGQPVTRIALGEWTVCYNQSLVQEIAALRAARLPNETGGVLLGIVDTSRRSIHLVRALPEPEDSSGTVTGFERGVAGLADAVNDAAERSLHQIRYVGEWHSHPAGSSTRPSATDIRQILWLTAELESEGLPALMLVAGDNGALRVVFAGKHLAASQAAS
ncbi:proteasome lid subunit RPN8/RPN11 [Sinorhizobium kostiense]|uniref:Proteasome lid subunit RPN8/RPN11 n=1 Tax=Sinorhizobium kostiense TaxID=76747 RepID=A0ABS4R709_9HYPH|nr:Mov34/MPN/PAD-1 family protein [Sinorhizobium kostiense]MBP2238674.1 proteasome lid subunit RPN8/RPN11 [Sinorhizobium kostiense]